MTQSLRERGRSRSRPRIRMQERSRERSRSRDRPDASRARRSKGKDPTGKDQKGKDQKGKDHKGKGKGKGKDTKSKDWKGKDTGSKGKHVQAPRNIDNLSDETLEWHEDTCKQVPKEDLENHRWRYEIFKYLRLVDEDSDSLRTDFCDNAFIHVDELDKRTNTSIVIGPGRFADSNDKIRFDLKFDFKTSGVSVPKNWKDKGIVKTLYILVVNRSEASSIGRDWTLLEE